MSEHHKISATRWVTPFEKANPSRLRLLRVTYPSCDWVTVVDGPHYDFSDFTEDGVCEILVFNEEDQTVYRIAADAFSIRIHDERDVPRIDDWAEDCGKVSIRLEGTDLFRSDSNPPHGREPTFLIYTSCDCVEFLCLNEPVIESIGTVADSRGSFH